MKLGGEGESRSVNMYQGGNLLLKYYVFASIIGNM